jgi:CheY-like chemotaxis protein
MAATHIHRPPDQRPTLRLIRQQTAREIIAARPSRLSQAMTTLTAMLSRHLGLKTACWLTGSSLLAFELSGWQSAVAPVAVALLGFFGIVAGGAFNTWNTRRTEASAAKLAAQNSLTQSSDKRLELTTAERVTEAARVEKRIDELFERGDAERARLLAECNRLSQRFDTTVTTMQTMQIVMQTLNRECELTRQRNGELTVGIERARAAALPRVLVVDDYSDTREMLGNAFRRHKQFRITTAGNMPEALDLYHEAIREGCPFKLLLLDYAMPGGTGLDLLKDIRASGDTDVNVIFYTGHPNDISADDCKAHRILKVLTKPLGLAELEREIVAGLQ